MSFSLNGPARSWFFRGPLWVALAAVALSGCRTLPNDGPGFRDVKDQYRDPPPEARPFALVDVNAASLSALRTRRAPSIAGRFPNEPSVPNLRIGRGDSLSISIWEAGTETLFSGSQTTALEGAAPPSARGVQIPEQTVGADGKISVPFAGRIDALGKSPVDVQKAIEKALAGKAARPQVLVSLAGNRSNMVTVIGEVIAGARVPLSMNGDRLLDVIASAGGVRIAAHEVLISLTRNGTTVSVPMTEVLRNPRENVFVRPGDSIVVTRQQRTYSAMGATGRTAQIPFESAAVNLIEAMAKAGGILDQRADPRGVYLFRLETQDVAARLGAKASEPSAAALIPVIYRLDLTQAGSYFLGQAFEMRDRDIIYVASAPTNEVFKFLQLLGAVSQPIIQGVIIDRTLK